MFAFSILRIVRLLSPDPQPGGGDPTPQPQSTPSDPKPGEDDNSKLAKALIEARKNSVPNEEYEKLQKEHKELLESIIEGGEGNGNGQPKPQEKADINALREELYGPKSSELSNLEVAEKTLKLREAVIEQEGYDPFLPYGAKIKPSEDDRQRANNLAKVMQECIDEADGSTDMFTAHLQSKLANDSPELLAKLTKKMGHRK